jgi:hypothetical protein
MGLLRAGDIYQVEKPKPERKKHKVTPIVGEVGRFFVDSHTLAKRGKEGGYIVDVLAKEETNDGTVTGTCPCKRWQIFKVCSHLIDAKEEYLKNLGAQAAEGMGLTDLDSPPVGNEEPAEDRPDKK